MNAPSSTAVNQYGQISYLSDTNLTTWSPVDTQQWTYIVITKDASNNGKFYKNGQLVYSGNYANVTYNWSRIDLGAVFFTAYGGWFKGWIDEIRMSNTVRTATSILNSYNSGTALASDANTIGLWHFDQSTGTAITATTGTNGSIVNSTWDANGRFGSCLYFNGTNARATIPQSVPTTNMTFEFWIKPQIKQNSWPVSWFAFNTAGFVLSTDTVQTSYTWSTGQTGNSIIVNPSTLPYVWVSNGSCRDTIFFNSQAATVYDTTNVTVYDTTNITVFDTTNVTIYDTLTINVYDTIVTNVYDTITTYTSVTDTLIINANITGVNPPSNSNTFLVYPNPASTHITIDNGNYTQLGNYSIRITNQLGQVVFNQHINQQQFYIDLSTWTGNGLYLLDILDNNGTVVENRKIVIQ